MLRVQSRYFQDAESRARKRADDVRETQALGMSSKTAGVGKGANTKNLRKTSTIGEQQKANPFKFIERKESIRESQSQNTLNAPRETKAKNPRQAKGDLSIENMNTPEAKASGQGKEWNSEERMEAKGAGESRKAVVRATNVVPDSNLSKPSNVQKTRREEPKREARKSRIQACREGRDEGRCDSIEESKSGKEAESTKSEGQAERRARAGSLERRVQTKQLVELRHDPTARGLTRKRDVRAPPLPFLAIAACGHTLPASIGEDDSHPQGAVGEGPLRIGDLCRKGSSSG